MEAASVSAASASASPSAASSAASPAAAYVREGLETIPKWKVALLLGAPVAVACALIYSYANSGKEENKTVTPSNDPKTPKTATVKPQEVEISPAKSLSNAIAIKDVGNRLLKQGKTEDAIAAYSRAISECPEIHEIENPTSVKARAAELAKIFQNRAFAHERVGKVDAALSDCDEAIRLDPSYARAWSRRSKAHELKGDFASSLDDLTAACILEEFKKEENLLAVDRVLKKLGKREAAAGFRTRPKFVPSNQFVRTYFAAFAHDPIFSATHSPRYDAFGTDSLSSSSSPFLIARRNVLEGKDLEDVVSLCEKECDLPDSLFRRESLLLKATFLLLRGSAHEALDDLNALLSMQSESAAATLVAAEGDSNASKHDIDIHVNALIKLGGLRMQICTTGEQRLDEADAMADFAAAAKLDPLNSDVFHHRGQLGLLLDRTAEACKDFENCVSLAPDFALAQVQNAYTQYRHRQSELNALSDEADDSVVPQKKAALMEETRRTFRELLEKFPDCAEGWALFGQILLDERQFLAADELFQKALEVEPDNGNVYVHRGLCRLQWDYHGVDPKVMEQQSVSDCCREYLEKALQVDPKCEFAYETLGTVEVQSGRLERASALFDKAIALAKTEMEMAHLISLNAASQAQINASRKLGVRFA